MPRLRLRTFGTRAISQKSARKSLNLLLCGARDEQFAQFTVKGLVPLFNVPEREIAQMLARAQDARGLRAS
jgi:hypothetical protein